MKKSVFRAVMKKVKNIEKSWDSLEEYVLFSTFGPKKHTLEMRDDFLFDDGLEKVRQALKDLERADLEDFRLLSEENGKFG